MPLVGEYALTPDVFDSACYSSAEVCALHLQALKEVLIQEGLVRNLRDGDWARVFATSGRAWHGRGKELLKKLATQGRMVVAGASSTTVPTTDADWCQEAIATHATFALNGIIATNAIASAHRATPIVCAVDRLASAPWWSGRSSSFRLNRSLADYQAALSLVLRHASHLMLIDPHIDPSVGRYAHIGQLLQGAAARSPAPKIEVHRVCYRGSGAARQVLTPAQLEATFRQALNPALANGPSVEVFVWDDFHDRYLISNIVGISVPNGFDVATGRNSRTTWTRLGRDDRDDVQREFDPATRRHALRARFTVP